MSAVLTAEQALKLVGEMFVYYMPFNRALGLELERYEKAFAQLAFNNQPMMVGNWAQSILHGGVIASALDVAAGLVCVGSTLTRHETISEDELRQRHRYLYGGIKAGKLLLHFRYEFSGWTQNKHGRAYYSLLPPILFGGSPPRISS